MATPTFRVEVYIPGTFTSDLIWRTREYGRPSDKALAAYVRAFEASTQKGGVNAHLGETRVAEAQIVRQSNGKVEAEYHRPMFEVI